MRGCRCCSADRWDAPEAAGGCACACHQVAPPWPIGLAGSEPDPELVDEITEAALVDRLLEGV